MRTIFKPASGWREIKALIFLHLSDARPAAQAGRPVDRSRAEPRDSFAQVVVIDRRGDSAGGRFRSA
jgi:hypothetical protein